VRVCGRETQGLQGRARFPGSWMARQVQLVQLMQLLQLLQLMRIP
jgi:hypothetical protein